MAENDKKITPQARYEKSSTVRINLKLCKSTDADVIARLKEVGNKQGYIKRLIRDDIEKSTK